MNQYKIPIALIKVSNVKKYIFKVLLLTLIISCSSGSSDSSSNDNDNQTQVSSSITGIAWNTNDFPLEIELSENLDPDQRVAIDNMFNQWNDAGSSLGLIFDQDINNLIPDPGFEFDTDYVEDNSAAGAGTMGVYIDNGTLKLECEPSSTNCNSDGTMLFSDSNALAITILSGQRNTLTGGVQLSQADIIVNGAGFNFTTDPTGVPGNFDFPTVLLHEAGHFVGLQHVNDPGQASIMQPSLAPTQIKRTVNSFDQGLLINNYTEGNGTTTVGTLRAALNEKIIMRVMLNSDGECLHHVNGKLVKKHHIGKLRGQ